MRTNGDLRRDAANGVPDLAPRFRVEIRPDRRRVLVVPHGELDLATADEVADEVDELVARGFDAIVIDLRATSFIDSTGLRLLIRETARKDARVTLIDGPKAVSRLFDLAGVRDLLPFETAR
jgi:anti-sigma B factor antagonist